MITDSKLKFWIDNNLNVLFIGKHGVGKTARVKEAFENAGLKWLYFSAATMDPWVDFIGIPKEVQEGDLRYIDLVKPKPFAEDIVEAIFMDEFNRAPKKVRNACLEIIQFHTLNGRRLKNLRIVWAAINPEDDKVEGTDELEYDVERLDPAQKDRFQVHVVVPYKPDKSYFLKKFGELSEDAIDWWSDLNQTEKNKVSPRRLDYALEVYTKGGDIRDVLPSDVNVSKLISELKNGSYIKLMKAVFAKNDKEEAKKFMAVRNNFDNTISKITKSGDLLTFFAPCIKEEDLVNLMSNDKNVYEHVVDNHSLFEPTINNILSLNNIPKLVKKLKKEPKLLKMANDLKTKVLSTKIGQLTFSNPALLVKPVVKNQYGIMFSSLGGMSFSTFINDKKTLSSSIRKGTQYRVGIYHKILQNVSDTESESDYLEALKTMCNIISCSHQQSLKQKIFKGFQELFGYLIARCKVYSNNTPQSIISKISPENGRVDKIEEFLFSNSQLYA